MKIYQLGSFKIYHPFDFLFKDQVDFLNHIHRQIQQQSSTIIQTSHSNAKTYLLFSYFISYLESTSIHNKFIYLVRSKKQLKEAAKIIKNIIQFKRHNQLAQSKLNLRILDYLQQNQITQFYNDLHTLPFIILSTHQYYINKLYTIDPAHFITFPSNFKQKSVIFLNDITTFDLMCESALSQQISETIVRKGFVEMNDLQNRMSMEGKLLKQLQQEKIELQFKNLKQKLKENSFIDLATRHLQNDKILINNIKYLLKYLKFKQRSYEVKKKNHQIINNIKKLPDFINQIINQTFISAQTLKNIYTFFIKFISFQKIQKKQVQCLLYICSFFSSLVIYKEDLLFQYHNSFHIVITLKQQNQPFSIKISCLQPKIIFDKFYIPSKSKSQKIILLINSTSSIQQQLINTNFKLHLKHHYFNIKQVTQQTILSLTVTCNAFQVDLKAEQNKQTQNYLQILRSYGTLINQVSQFIPDGIIIYVRSNKYLQSLLQQWQKQDILNQIRKKKMIFVESPIQLQNKNNIIYFKQAIDVGKGAIFIMNVRSKVSQFQQFKGQYSNMVIFIGYPILQQTQLYFKQKFEYLKQKSRVTDKYLYLQSDAMRHVNKCLTNVLGQNKLQRKIILLADARFNAKLTPKWLYVAQGNLNISTSIQRCKNFIKNYRKQRLLKMIQKYVTNI